MEHGLNMELINYVQTDSNEGINFISRTSKNNGISAKIFPVKNIEPHEGGVLTCALGGSVLSTFVQEEPFYSGYHIMILEPKEDLSLNEMLYYCLCIKSNQYRYSFGRQANLTLKDLELPDNIPEWVYETRIKKPISKNKKNKLPDFEYWKLFTIEELFEEIYKPTVYHKINLEIENKKTNNNVKYITRSRNNNGLSGYVQINDNLKIEDGNAISAAGEGIIYLYQDEKFICGNNMSILRSSKLNKYNGLFLTSVLNYHLNERYSYGRALISKRFKKDKVFLPSNSSGNPDWKLMEDYVKNNYNGDLI